MRHSQSGNAVPPLGVDHSGRLITDCRPSPYNYHLQTKPRKLASKACGMHPYPLRSSRLSISNGWQRSRKRPAGFWRTLYDARAAISSDPVRLTVPPPRKS